MILWALDIISSFYFLLRSVTAGVVTGKEEGESGKEEATFLFSQVSSSSSSSEHVLFQFYSNIQKYKEL